MATATTLVPTQAKLPPPPDGDGVVLVDSITIDIVIDSNTGSCLATRMYNSDGGRQENIMAICNGVDQRVILFRVSLHILAELFSQMDVLADTTGRFLDWMGYMDRADDARFEAMVQREGAELLRDVSPLNIPNGIDHADTHDASVPVIGWIAAGLTALPPREQLHTLANAWLQIVPTWVDTGGAGNTSNVPAASGAEETT
ncbi:hypothetical protein HJFPF1_07776 [Paramyrothecium foliicola]|nr:hypothetical protein HJFPF1_07776 [Paramyrothecium foliicola]